MNLCKILYAYYVCKLRIHILIGKACVTGGMTYIGVQRGGGRHSFAPPFKTFCLGFHFKRLHLINIRTPPLEFLCTPLLHI